MNWDEFIKELEQFGRVRLTVHGAEVDATWENEPDLIDFWEVELSDGRANISVLWNEQEGYTDLWKFLAQFGDVVNYDFI